MLAKYYQEALIHQCRLSFPEIDIKNEWAAFSGQMHKYSPRVDIAFGPFNIEGPDPNLTETYNLLVQDPNIHNFLYRAYQYHISNVDIHLYNEIVHPDFEFMVRKNQNSRCLIAIEIENTNSKKHMMGSIVNAASLGRIGIGVAYCQSALRTFLRIINYLNFLRRVEKNTYDTTNFLILNVEQMNSLVTG